MVDGWEVISMPAAMDERQAISEDGTTIGYRSLGSGPPLVMVHGGWVTGARWLAVAEDLADSFECHVMDRRARGLSGDGAHYALDREIEDIAAVLDAVGPGANLLGHSSGAIFALETAKRKPVDHLIAYEPPLLFQGPEAEQFVARIGDAVAGGDSEGAATIFFGEEVGLSDEAMAMLTSTAVWSEIVSLAWTWVREAEAVHLGESAPEVGRFAAIETPTLLLGGTETRSHPSFATRELNETMPDARVAWLEGQGHTSHQSAPELVAQEVRQFLERAV